MEFQKLVLGKEYSFSGYPVELFYSAKEDTYYVSCKNSFINAKSYMEWNTNKRKNIIGHNKEGKPCKIKQINGLVKVSCLSATQKKFSELVINLLNEIECHKQKV